MPTVVVLGLNRFGEQVYEYLTDHPETEVLCLVTEESQYSTIEKLDPDFLVSAGFDQIIPDRIIDAANRAAINLHPSYLPYNKGVNPDIWSIIEDEPAGVSIHYMTSEMDAGPIIVRKKVCVYPDDTGRTLRKRLDAELVELFENNWEDIYLGNLSATDQSQEGTTNYSHELQNVCEIDSTETVTAGELIDRLRALTFPPYDNAYFKEDGTKYYIRVEIMSEEALDSDAVEWDTPTLF